MNTRTLIIRQGPKRFIIVEENTETLDCLVLPNRAAREQGVGMYTYSCPDRAAREGHAQVYRTIKAALEEFPEAERAPEYDIEADG